MDVCAHIVCIYFTWTHISDLIEGTETKYTLLELYIVQEEMALGYGVLSAERPACRVADSIE